MNNIPFAAFPRAERDAVLAAVRRAGMATRSICVSRLELPEAPDAALAPVALVTAPNWFRSYAPEAGWVGRLEQDLGRLRR